MSPWESCCRTVSASGVLCTGQQTISARSLRMPFGFREGSWSLRLKGLRPFETAGGSAAGGPAHVRLNPCWTSLDSAGGHGLAGPGVVLQAADRERLAAELLLRGDGADGDLGGLDGGQERDLALHGHAAHLEAVALLRRLEVAARRVDDEVDLAAAQQVDGVGALALGD